MELAWKTFFSPVTAETGLGQLIEESNFTERNETTSIILEHFRKFY